MPVHCHRMSLMLALESTLQYLGALAESLLYLPACLFCVSFVIFFLRAQIRNWRYFFKDMSLQGGSQVTFLRGLSLSPYIYMTPSALSRDHVRLKDGRWWGETRWIVLYGD